MNERLEPKLHPIPHFVDDRGDLNVIELASFPLFPVRRIFYTYNVPGEDSRGEHAHKVCEQFLIAVKGSLEVVTDDGARRKTFTLDSPSQGLHLPPGWWGIERKHSPDCVLMVLASHPYENADYIRDYDTFLAYRKAKGAEIRDEGGGGHAGRVTVPGNARFRMEV